MPARAGQLDLGEGPQTRMNTRSINDKRGPKPPKSVFLKATYARAERTTGFCGRKVLMFSSSISATIIVCFLEVIGARPSRNSRPRPAPRTSG